MAEEKKQRGYLEEILVQIPGFKGYLACENRRESDLALRESVATRLATAKKAVGEAKRRMLSCGTLEGLEPLDRVADRLEKVVTKIRHAERGYSGFFATQQIGPAELERLLEADGALTELAQKIETKLAELPRAAAGEPLQTAVEAALDAIASLESTFDNRKSLMMEVG